MQRPEFSAPFLSAIADAFLRRGKAIRYQAKLLIQREIDANEERLNVDYEGTFKLRLRLSVWITGDWWFLACQQKPGRSRGWLFKHELRGVLGHLRAESIVKSFEDSMLIGYWSPAERLAKLYDIWRLPPPSVEP